MDKIGKGLGTKHRASGRINGAGRVAAENYMPIGSGNRKCVPAAVSRPIGMSALILKPHLQRPQAVEIMLGATETSYH